MRVQRRNLWVPTLPTGVYAIPTGERAFERVLTLKDMAAFLQTQLYSAARVHSGLLFGFAEDEVLTVVLVSSPGVAEWYTPGPPASVEVDSRFTLGWSEALLSVLGGKVDWIGNWTAHADHQLRSETRDLRRFGTGFDTGLFDDRYILMVAGWEDAVFDLRCYRRGLGGRPERVPSDIGMIDSGALLQDWWLR